MIHLLRNLNLVTEPVKGWDRLPRNNDNSLGANLTRVNVYRNKLSHFPKSQVDDGLFMEIWSSLEMVCDITHGSCH